MQSLALATVLREQRDGCAGPSADLEQVILYSVRGAVVDHDHLFSSVGGEDRVDALLDELRRLVEAGDDHGDLLAVVRRVGTGPNVVCEQEAEQPPCVDDEQEQVPEGEAFPEANIRRVLREEQRRGRRQDGERAVDRGLSALPGRRQLTFALNGR